MLDLPVQLDPFAPPRFLSDAHAQTILAYLAPSPRLPGWGARASEPSAASNDRIDKPWRVAVSGGDEVVAHYFEGRLPTVVYVFHGLGGESHGSYMQRTALVALDLGFSVVVANHRGCGEGVGLAREPYHSGRAEDLGAVVAEGRARFPTHRHIAIGFSLSGNAVLLLAAGVRVATRAGIPDAVLAVNAPIELARASRKLSQGLNRVYDAKFMGEMRESVRAREKAGASVPASARKIGWLSTCWDFDEAYTAPAGGFRDRADYYASCSAMPHLQDIQVPTVMLMSEDDPFVPVDSYRRAKLAPCVSLRIEKHGGHMGYLSAKPTPLGTHRWLDWAVHEYLTALNAADRR